VFFSCDLIFILLKYMCYKSIWNSFKIKMNEYFNEKDIMVLIYIMNKTI